jgi:hypothetical protein
MKRSIVLGCASILATSMVIFVANINLVRSQQTDAIEAQYKQINKLQHVPSEVKRNPQLERAIFRDLNVDKSALIDINSNDSYTYNYVDLNGDGKPEVIVYLSGRYFCGTGGCQVLIFKLVGKEYKSLSGMGLVRPPFIVTEAKSNKYKNLVMYSRNYGVRKGDYGDFYSFNFNGKNYPGAADSAVRLKATSTIRGKVYFDDKKINGIKFIP